MKYVRSSTGDYPYCILQFHETSIRDRSFSIFESGAKFCISIQSAPKKVDDELTKNPWTTQILNKRILHHPAGHKLGRSITQPGQLYDNYTPPERNYTGL